MTPGSESVVIHGQGLTKLFGAARAVDKIDLEVRRGRTLALIGPSGCGKTTTLRLIAGFEVPDGGVITLDGQVVAGPGRFVPPERRRVGMVFQDYALFPHLDLADNVAYGLPSRQDRAGRIREMLDLVGLTGLERRYPHELSGGQQQRVALARALAPAPALLLLDEPFSNLDASLRARVRVEVCEILESVGATTIFVTHDQDEALSLADEVAVMDRGRILQVGTPEEVYSQPSRREVALLLGEANLLPGEFADGEVISELGRFPVQAPASAGDRVDLVIRPEAISLEPAESEGAATAEIVRREFFGHDQRLTVRLSNTGRLLTVRLGPTPSFHFGERVQLRVRGPVAVFPEAGSSGRPA
jgi:iron(III) transport system ATP-binding protein